MASEIDRILSRKYNPRFGQIALENGYATPAQVKQALLEQEEDNLASRPHRLIGRIMLDRGWMNARQIENVLNNLFIKDSKNETREVHSFS